MSTDVQEAAALSLAPPQGLDDAFFLQPAWFELLAREGLATPPRRVHALEVPGVAGAVLHVMQQSKGAPLCSLSNYYTPMAGLCGVPAAAMGQVDWPALAARLKAVSGSAVVHLGPLAEQGAVFAGLRDGLRAQGYLTSSHVCFGNWHLPLADGAGFEAYWLERPSRMKHTVERARRRLARAHDWRIEVVDKPGDALERAIAAYESVYADSWKPAEPRPGFIPELMRLAARQGHLRLGVLWVDGCALAAQLWLVCEGKASIFKLAYRQGHERLSPGSVLTAALMQRAIDVDRVREVDYLMGDDAYKQDWMTHRRERVALLAFDPMRPAGAWAALRHAGGRWLRAWRQKLRPDAPASV